MEKFKELWKNDRTKSAIKLFAWFLFLMLIIIFCSLSQTANNIKENNRTPSNKAIEFKSLDDMKEILLTKQYKYIYKLSNTSDNSFIIYTGSVNELEETGYYESKEEVYKYSCAEKCYKVFTDHQEEISLTKPVKSKLQLLFEDLKPITLKEEESNDLKTYSYNSLNNTEYNEIKITTSVNEIKSIHVVKGTETYDINFEY